MLTTRGNVHHSSLPALGAIGYLVQGRFPYGGTKYLFGDNRERWQCVAYPLSDSAPDGLSLGIHTALFQRLSDGETRRASGFYFVNHGDVAITRAMLSKAACEVT